MAQRSERLAVGALCVTGGVPFAQDSIFVYGGSLVTLSVSGDSFSNEQVLLAPQGAENNYYPSYSPDGAYIACQVAGTSSRVMA